MLNAYIISVNTDKIEESSDNHSHNSEKYRRRRDYIKKEIIPKIDFCQFEIFDAITPDLFKIEGNSILYKDIVFKRGIDWNSKSYPHIYLNSITLTSYFLYKKCIEINKPIFILQDDFLIKDDSINNIKDSINDFLNIKNPSILYLQSECPWMNGLPIRDYPEGTLLKVSNNLSLIDSNWYDLAGNVGYVINVEGSKIMINIIEQLGLSNDDQLTTIAMKNKLLEVYTCNNYKKMILLNRDLQ